MMSTAGISLFNPAIAAPDVGVRRLRLMHDILRLAVDSRSSSEAANGFIARLFDEFRPEFVALYLRCEAGASQMELVELAAKRPHEINLPDCISAENAGPGTLEFDGDTERETWLIPLGESRESPGLVVLEVGDSTSTDTDRLLLDAACDEFSRWLATAQHRERLHKTAAMHRAAFFNHSCASICVDKRLRVTEWNRRAEDLFGWMRGDAIGRRAPFICGEHRNRIAQKLLPVFQGQKIHRQTVDVRDAWGREFVVHMSADPVRNDNGHTDFVMLTLEIDSESRDAHCGWKLRNAITTALSNSQNCDDAVHHSLAAMSRHLSCSHAEYWNLIPEENSWRLEAARRRGGVISDRVAEPSATCGGVPDASFGTDRVFTLPIDELSPVPLCLQEQRGRMGHVTVLPIETCGKTQGAFLLFHSESDAVAGNTRETLTLIAQEFQGFVANLVMRRENERLRARCAQNRKLEVLGRSVGGIVHDFNNLLQILLGNCDLIADTLDPESESFQSVQHMETAVERAASLTGRLMAFVRQEPERPVVIRPRDCIGQLKEVLKGMVRRGIDIEFEADMSSQLVRIDAGEFEQIVLNLVGNASDAMHDDGSIRIGLRQAGSLAAKQEGNSRTANGDYVVLAVRDEGTGMDAAAQRRIFEPFFTTKPAGHGTGLGLATVHEIVERAGGFITVDSTPGHGSTFYVHLPRCLDRPETEQVLVESTPLPCGNETILLVEDEVILRRVTASILRVRGYEVLVAVDGQQAIDIARRHREIDLLLTDIVMPACNGLELAEQMQINRPGLRTLLMTGCIDFEECETPFPILRKPFTTRSLATTVRWMLDA